MKKIIAFSFTILGLLASCKEVVKTKSTDEKSSTKEVVIREDLQKKNTHRISVIEKIDAGGYIYLKVLEKENEYWMAIPGRNIELGATYYYDGGMEMRNFESKNLKRTFDAVIFAEGVRDKNKGGETTVKRNVDKGGTNVVDVDKAPNGIRIATLFENPKEYRNKQVIIKGQVVKVNNGIMGVNFVHLQDGTKGNGAYDVTLTSNDNFKVGDVVTIKGTVVLNKDFGAGYVYDVLVEKAVIFN